MEAIADIVRAHPNLIVISDEVYKFSVYRCDADKFIQTYAHSPPSPHTCTHPSPSPMEPGDSTSIGHYHFARLPGMFDRTITLSR